MQISCSICSDLFSPSDEISVTPCGHLFHFVCVTQWLERSKSCPQCRARATDSNIHRVFFNVPSTHSVEDTSTLENKLDTLSFEIRLKDMDLKTIREENETFKFQTSGLKVEVKKLEESLDIGKSTIFGLKEQIKLLRKENKDTVKARNECNELRQKLEDLQNVETVVRGVSDEVKDLLKNYSLSTESLRSLSIFVTILKKELKESTDKRKRLRELLLKAEDDLKCERKEREELLNEVNSLKFDNKLLKEDLLHTEESNRNLTTKCDKLTASIESPSGGNLQSKALRRLIAESPAPEEIKRPRLTSPDDDIPPMKKVTSPHLKLKSSSVGLTPLGNRVGKYSIFQKPRLRLLQECETSTRSGNTEVFYDGHGGHSKLEVFPKPIKSLTLKKVKSCSALSKTASSNHITNFFDLTQSNKKN